MLIKIRLKKGDNVMVRSGKYKGQTGQVLTVHNKTNEVTVEGINVVKKHIKPNRQHPQGGIVEITKPVPVSKVGIFEPDSKKPSRISYKISEDSQKTRVFQKSGKDIK